MSEFDKLLRDNRTTIEFFSNLFDYENETIIEDLKTRESQNEDFELTNIGFLKNNNGELKVYPNFEQGLIEYFYSIIASNNIARNVTHNRYEGNADYIKELIQYFSSIYTNVNPQTLIAIGAAESGHFSVAGMLRHNNIYGGMSNGRLITYNNIEHGVHAFVRLMSQNYYGQGLTTLEEIGAVYNPVFINGERKANSHWIRLVTDTHWRYREYTNTITINELLKIEE